PHFNHPEIENLYRYGFDLPTDVIEAILQLPRATVIADLEAVLRGAIDRYDAYQELEWNENTQWFPFHAMLLLGGLRAEESLPLLLEVHRQDGKWIDFWFSDWFWDEMWEPLMWCGMNRLNDLAEFVKDNNIAGEYVPSNALEVMAQAALHFPEKREEVVEKLKELFDFYLRKEYTDALRLEVECNVTILASAVDDLKEDSLLPLVEQCYDNDLVDLGMFGDWEEFITSYRRDNDCKRNIFPNVADWYAHELEAQKKREERQLKWEESMQEKVKKPILGTFTPSYEPIIKSTKVGRNEPCPCGSGKKYKRCCGIND
ncbi:MAG: DUF1186 domain-containing protein, partial [Bacteroidota bacterium]